MHHLPARPRGRQPAFISSTPTIAHHGATRWPNPASSPTRRATRMELKTGNQTPANLITADWLKQYLHKHGSHSVRILDVRGQVRKTEARTPDGFQAVEYEIDDNAYFAGHVPDARFVDWRTIDLASHEDFCDDMSQKGVQRELPVLVYDWGDMLFATRLWFALLTMGCQDVRVLDGGWAAWDVADGPVGLDTACPLKTYSEFDPRLAGHERPRESIAVGELLPLIKRPPSDLLLLDARSERLFSGREFRRGRAGRIPNAVSMPYRSLLQPDGIGLLHVHDLVDVLAKDGVLDRLRDGAAHGITYCNGGVASCLLLFCLVRCGVPWERIRNYCGSFNEWADLTHLPVETG